MDDQNKNLLLATSLSFLVLVGWMLLFPPQEIEPIQPDEANNESSDASGFQTKTIDTSKTLNADINETRDVQRVPIETARLSGSISLRGGRIDDLKLLDYFDDQSADSNNVIILKERIFQNNVLIFK